MCWWRANVVPSSAPQVHLDDGVRRLLQMTGARGGADGLAASRGAVRRELATVVICLSLVGLAPILGKEI